ncbi:YdbC family protein [Priestia megaterium]|uniref:YdbC family protein n=1 Tax=Priestia megaterium TaxID=1404 RepID=UPI00249B46F0|nr:YdbC family protein [Priestia megaterium]MDI3092484.1 YdbC family protein [Priestia megaterium]
MLTKIVKCSIPTDKKASFSYTQQHWAALAHVNGFIGQLGGWNVEDKTDACILALWEDGTTYQEFMKHTHDSIFYKSKQDQTYTNLDVSTSDPSYFIGARYNYYRSSAIESRYLVKTEIEVDFYDKEDIHEMVKSLINPSYRCLSHVVSPIEHSKLVIFSLYGSACPQKTIDTFVHPNVLNASQYIYQLEKNWNVLSN